ncbi:hypothetical protein FACUT_1130 [Fusarium acutatum]|uniref:Protein kinase domain-containing protein n=1 Tax=Fusarium acutatum TaxID=78861 RepID=A0A8H4K4R6_9HYPO|nr:hypothetical protein FACUT_1130 [Fusarium acutatum]
MDGEAALQAGIVSYIGYPTPPQTAIQLDTSASDLALEISKPSELLQIMLISTSYKVTGSWLQTKFPEWFLPDKIVLKRQKENWEEEFDHEVVAYNRMRPIQGLTTPKLYGTIQYASTRALILSDIGGSSLSKPHGSVLDEQDIEPLLHQALTSLNEYGVCHDDTKLDNFHLVADEKS